MLDSIRAVSAGREPTALLVGGVMVLSFFWWVSTRRPKGLPPGPSPALPLLGHLHLLKRDPRDQLSAWRQKYGNIFSLYMGGRLVIVLNSYPVIREALVKFADVFSDRPHVFFTDVITKNKGIVSSSGTHWKEQRKVSLEILREMGLGKNILAEKVQEEVIQFTKAIAVYQGQACDLRELTNVSISNNICSIVFGKRHEYDDPQFKTHLATVEENFKLLSGAAVLNFFPFLQYLPGDLFSVKKVLANVDKAHDMFLRPQLDKHLKDYTDGDASDFINAYIREIRRRQEGNQETTITEKNLNTVIGDLFAAGTESTATVIRWALIYFLHYPDVQEKCFQEILSVVGAERTPSIRDRPELTYTEATIMEVMRRSNISPFVQHGLADDVVFQGYTFPKDAIIFVNYGSVLHDPDTWEDPLEFRPERFIDPDGKLTRPEEFIVFGIGRRACLGEALARMELFLYISAMLQRFHFLPAEDESLPSLEGSLGITVYPKPFKIRAVLRQIESR